MPETYQEMSLSIVQPDHVILLQASPSGSKLTNQLQKISWIPILGVILGGSLTVWLF